MTRIAHYKILEKIGEGAMGVVFLAEDTRLDRRVALKVLLKENPDGSRGKRFEREAKAIAALSHPVDLRLRPRCQPAVHRHGAPRRPYPPPGTR
jgi:serine/threonine protein kinase